MQVNRLVSREAPDEGRKGKSLARWVFEKRYYNIICHAYVQERKETYIMYVHIHGLARWHVYVQVFCRLSQDKDTCHRFACCLCMHIPEDVKRQTRSRPSLLPRKTRYNKGHLYKERCESPEPWTETGPLEEFTPGEDPPGWMIMNGLVTFVEDTIYKQPHNASAGTDWWRHLFDDLAAYMKSWVVSKLLAGLLRIGWEVSSRWCVNWMKSFYWQANKSKDAFKFRCSGRFIADFTHQYTFSTRFYRLSIG